VRALLAVLDLPRRDLPPRIEQVLEPTHGQTLFPQPSVETLDVRVLRRLGFSRANSTSRVRSGSSERLLC